LSNFLSWLGVKFIHVQAIHQIISRFRSGQNQKIAAHSIRGVEICKGATISLCGEGKGKSEWQISRLKEQWHEVKEKLQGSKARAGCQLLP
jgi:hypothetical protein